MKKLTVGVFCSLTIALPIYASSCADSCDCEISARSYLRVRPLFTSDALTTLVAGFRNDLPHAREDGKGGAVQFTLLGSKSSQTKELQRYFLPFCKTELIADNNPDFFVKRDLFPDHFNIFYPNGVNFKSRISIDPEQSVIGFGMHYRQSFWHNEEKGRAFWVSVSSPITRVKNRVNLTEEILEGIDAEINEAADTEGTVQPNLMAAFQQDEWKFGKIDPNERTETKLADIEVKLGYEWLQHEPYHLESYVGIIIPTTNAPDGEFLFDAIVGNADHFGVMFGSAGGFEIWNDEEKDRTLRIEYASNSQYLFEKEETRSFDLKDRPFSRYIQVYANEEQAAEAAALSNTDATRARNLATPGINVFTRKVDVTPGFSYNLNTAFVLTCEKFQGEVGYNFYARRSECVKLSSPWQEGPAVKALGGSGTTNPARVINAIPQIELSTLGTAFEDYQNNIIKETDLDLVSASTPSALSHVFYGTLGYRCDERDYPLFAYAGGSYEFSNSNNSVLERWVIWGKFGFSF